MEIGGLFLLILYLHKNHEVSLISNASGGHRLVLVVIGASIEVSNYLSFF